MTESLNLVAWLACIVYSTIPSFWLAIHPRAKYWRSRRRSPYRVLLPLWIAMWIAAGLITAPWRHLVLYSSLWAWVPAIFLFGVGFWLYSQSGQHFSVQQLSGIPEVMAGARERRLMTAFALLSGAVMTNLEDKELEQRFGEGFRQYKSSVPAIVPRLH